MLRQVSIALLASLALASPTMSREQASPDAPRTYRAVPRPCASDHRGGGADPMLLQVEQLLQALGWSVDDPDGLNDQRTTRAVRVWRRQNNYRDGRLSCHDLIDALRMELASASAPQNPLSAGRPSDPTLARPSRLIAGNRINSAHGTLVDLTWTDNSHNEDGFVVEFSNNRTEWLADTAMWHGDPARIESTGRRMRVLLRDQPADGLACYRVRAVTGELGNTLSQSAPSTVACAR